jgi:hypothetical protein
VTGGHGVRALAAAIIKQCVMDARCSHTPVRQQQAIAWLLAERSAGRAFWCAVAGVSEIAVTELARRTLQAPTSHQRAA